MVGEGEGEWKRAPSVGEGLGVGVAWGDCCCESMPESPDTRFYGNKETKLILQTQ